MIFDFSKTFASGTVNYCVFDELILAKTIERNLLLFSLSSFTQHYKDMGQKVL